MDPGTTNFGVNVAGFVLHSAIHAARPDAKCVIHIHHHSCVAVSFSCFITHTSSPVVLDVPSFPPPFFIEFSIDDSYVVLEDIFRLFVCLFVLTHFSFQINFLGFDAFLRDS